MTFIHTAKSFSYRLVRALFQTSTCESVSEYSSIILCILRLLITGFTLLSCRWPPAATQPCIEHWPLPFHSWQLCKRVTWMNLDKIKKEKGGGQSWNCCQVICKQLVKQKTERVQWRADLHVRHCGYEWKQHKVLKTVVECCTGPSLDPHCMCTRAHAPEPRDKDQMQIEAFSQSPQYESQFYEQFQHLNAPQCPLFWSCFWLFNFNFHV